MAFKMKKGEGGQVTIFIIVAIVIVVGILLIVYFTGGLKSFSQPQKDPKKFIKSCVEDAVEDSLVPILKNAGKIESGKSFIYDGVEYNYLCYQGNYFQTCYNIRPMIEYLIEDEIRKDTEDEVKKCFDNLKEDWENRGYEVSEGQTNYSIDLLPGMIKINLNKRIDVSRDGTSQSFENFDLRVLSSVYELVKIAKNIVNAEAKYCSFEYGGYMAIYPRYDIKRINYDNNKIYILKDRISEEEFKFVVRSCALPEGI